MQARLLICLSVLLSVPALAQPVIRSGNGVLNSASYLTPGLPASGIAQGSLFVVFGTGLGPARLVQATKFPLPDELADTSIKVTVGGVSKSAVMVYTYAGQVAAIMPSSMPTGAGTITLTFNGQTSQPAAVQVVAGAFGIYTFNSRGTGQAIATDAAYRVNTIIHTFHPGDLAILWGTGLGPIAASDANAPPVGDVPGDVQVMVGNTAANIYYRGRSGCCSGVDQIMFYVPPGVEGCAVPVGVRVGGVISNIATLAVSKDGQTCQDSVMGQTLVDKLVSGQRVGFGYVRLETGAQLGDWIFATFSELTPQTAGLAHYGVSSGYCVAVDCSQGCAINGTPNDLSPAQLDAGSSLALAAQSRPSLTIPGYQGWYAANLNPGGGPRYLWGGLPYDVSWPGGSQVGSFSTTITMNSKGAQFAHIVNGQSVPMKNDLPVAWDSNSFGSKDRLVSINGLSASNNFELYTYLQCNAPAGANQFTIPAWVLSFLPPSGSTARGDPLGYLWIGQYDTPLEFQAQGLDRGLMTNVIYYLRTVRFE